MGRAPATPERPGRAGAVMVGRIGGGVRIRPVMVLDPADFDAAAESPRAIQPPPEPDGPEAVLCALQEYPAKHKGKYPFRWQLLGCFPAGVARKNAGLVLNALKRDGAVVTDGEGRYASR